ncbi:MAG: glycine cleavage system protein GcvH [Clostridia bacterium]|nr:glycine cleavage system protein GcvH [Clostridia bacterium]
MIPKDLKYTESHEWIIVEDGVGTVGITHHAQDQLGDIVFVDLPEIDDSFGKGDIFGSVESVKSVSDLYIPASGKVLEINESLLDSPELLNQEPYEDGWIVKIQLEDVEELDDLMDAGEYEDQLD